VEIDPAADNQAAVRCYAAAGFQPVGTMRQYEKDLDGDEWHDGLLMELLADDLSPRRPGRGARAPGEPDLKVRAANLEDVPEVLRLAALMYTALGQSEGLDEVWGQAATSALAERLGRDAAVFVAEAVPRPGVLLASAAGSVTARLPGPHNPSARVGYVQWVWAEPEVRGQGLGRAVMDALMGWFKDQQVPVVELNASPLGEALYRSLGFSEPRNRSLRARL
jgi:RimJ/RimL family protein N-acetyltransferase